MKTSIVVPRLFAAIAFVASLSIPSSALGGFVTGCCLPDAGGCEDDVEDFECMGEFFFGQLCDDDNSGCHAPGTGCCSNPLAGCTEDFPEENCQFAGDTFVPDGVCEFFSDAATSGLGPDGACITNTPTPTSTPTPTATSTPTSTPTATPSATASRVPNGGTCVDPADCASGNCVDDGICCDRPCDGGGESCNQPGRAGTCLPLPAAAPTASNGALLVAIVGLSLIGTVALVRRRRT